MEEKPLTQRIPWWGWVVIVFLGLSVMGSIIAPNKTNQKSQTPQSSSPPKKAISDEMEQKVEKLRADMVENLNKDVGQNLFTDTHLQHIADNNFKLTLTIKDDWYYMKEFQQERLLEDVWQYINLLGNKSGLRKEDDMPWKVVFVDSYEKELAKKGW